MGQGSGRMAAGLGKSSMNPLGAGGHPALQGLPACLGLIRCVALGNHTLDALSLRAHVPDMIAVKGQREDSGTSPGEARARCTQRTHAWSVPSP